MKHSSIAIVFAALVSSIIFSNLIIPDVLADNHINRRATHAPQSRQAILRSAANLRRVSAVSEVIGDANGDDVFTREDAYFARELINQRRLVLRRGNQSGNRLVDVAEPCGKLNKADIDRIIAALRARNVGIEIESECHHQAIGTEFESHNRKPPPRVPVTLDDLFLKITDAVPEFGGFYMQGDTMKVVLTDPSDARLKRALNQIAKVYGGELPPAEKFEAVEGKYNFAKLQNWRISARALFKHPKVVSIDADERNNRLTVGLEDLQAQSEVVSLLNEMNVPTDGVKFIQRKRFEINEHLLLPELQGERRPLRGGLEIGFPVGGGQLSACSLGVLAQQGWDVGFITNSHCTGSAGLNNRTFNQNASGSQVGVETKDPNLFTNSQNSACPSGETCRWSDAAFVTIDNGVTGVLGRLSKSRHVFPYTGTYNIVGKPLFPLLCGMSVRKVGRSSGETGGPIDSTCCDTEANWSSIGNSPNVVTMLCQNIVDGKGNSGDSGGPVIQRSGYYNALLAGLYWGRLDDEFAYSPIENIEAELGWLYVKEDNKKPNVNITKPAYGANLGSGAFFTVDAEATFFDFENGTGCSTCEMRWLSTKDGYLGTTPLVDGKSNITFNLSGTGKRLIIAVGKDSKGNLGPDYIEVTTSNSAPNVYIEWPANGDTLYAGQNYVFQGNSFDNELFSPLPCNSLTWTSQQGGTTSLPANGCSPQVKFTATGQKTIVLTGTDSQNASDTASVNINVVNMPSTGAPIVSWLFPVNQNLLAPDQGVQLKGTATDPDGKSPINYEWRILGNLKGGLNNKVIGTTATGNGNVTGITFKPSDHVAFNCGGTPVTLMLTATDQDNQVGFAVVDVVIAYPPC